MNATNAEMSVLAAKTALLEDLTTYCSMKDLLEDRDHNDEFVVEKKIMLNIIQQLQLEDRFTLVVVLGHYPGDHSFEMGLHVGVNRRIVGTEDLLEISIFKVQDPSYDYDGSGTQGFLAARKVAALRDHFWIRTAQVYDALK